MLSVAFGARLTLNMPTREILRFDYSDKFGLEDVASFTPACEAALSNLRLVDRSDPITHRVANLIINLAKDGERDFRSQIYSGLDSAAATGATPTPKRGRAALALEALGHNNL